MSSLLLLPANGVQWGRSHLKRLPTAFALLMGTLQPLPDPVSTPVVLGSNSDDSLAPGSVEGEGEVTAEQKKANPEYDEEYLKYLEVMKQKMREYPPDFPLHLRDRDLSHVINKLLHKARNNPAFQHEWDYYPNIMTPRSARREPGPQQQMWKRFRQRNPFLHVCLQQIGEMVDRYQAAPSVCCKVAVKSGVVLMTRIKKLVCLFLEAIYYGLHEDLL